MRTYRPNVATVAGLLLLVSCSPTDADMPTMVGPDEVVGIWHDYQIVCTVPLTLRTPFPIEITGGTVRVVFPAEGEPKAAIDREFSEEEVRTLWGAALQDTTTRSVEINPLVQFEDYEATISFHFAGDRVEGSLRHVVKCRADTEPQP